MSVCLNTESANMFFHILVHDRFYVDKTGIIEIINAKINTMNRYICITKPRRFGKTSVLNMLGAYYCKTYDSKELFDGLKICSSESYEEHLNQYNVINLCLNDLPDDGSTYEDYINLIKESIADDIKEAYPELKDKKFRKISELLTATKEQFIFIIDEWDYIFSHELYTEHHGEFLEFLRNLLKDRPYVALAYMTGVLPIKKYSTGSALNMFKEYTMLKDPFFEEYFGFTESEVKALCEKQSVLTMDEINNWYNGYQTRIGARLYNPRSVVCALEDAACQSYWTRTGKMDEVLFFLKYNISEVRDDVVKMVNDTPVIIGVEEEYSAGQENPKNRKEIYSAMIIYGLLSYHDGEIRIPNKELMLEFQKALEDDDFGYVAELVRNSDEVLSATLEKKGDIVASYLHNIHNSELPILKYNDENSLSCVVTLAYLSARNKYRIEREEKSGKGYEDFIFHPRRKNMPGIVLELKADDTPEAAIAQIKSKEYCEKLRKENVENILAVGLSYDTGRKEHQCVIEEISFPR
ncbi:MAG: ATP-binding protein [Lachnospiraceae bacterium]|nr:ATP-binding protein [Lachnospiraceae bacterium]